MEKKEQDDHIKAVYRVGDVSHLVDVDPYVLRYWEKMFPQLKPKKDDTGQRIYIKSDIDLVLRIKELLYEERYTIAGAKKKLNDEGEGKNIKDERFLESLRNIKNTLKDISSILDRTE